MKYAVLAAILGLSACTATPQMIEAQKSRCTQLGYAVGSLEHAQCADRGTIQQQGMQNAAAGAAAGLAVDAIIWNALLN